MMSFTIITICCGDISVLLNEKYSSDPSMNLMRTARIWSGASRFHSESCIGTSASNACLIVAILLLIFRQNCVGILEKIFTTSALLSAKVISVAILLVIIRPSFQSLAKLPSLFLFKLHLCPALVHF